MSTTTQKTQVTKEEETRTQNVDNHEKHKDNELKNLQKEVENVKTAEEEKKSQPEDKDKEVSKDKEQDADKKDTTQKRVRELTQDEAAAVKEAQKDDTVQMSKTSVNMLAVVAQETISALPGQKLTASLRSAPLSSFVFGSVSRAANTSYCLSPFKMTDTIPQLFKFKALYNESQQTNVPDMVITKFTTDGVLDVVSKSIELFNISTMTVRTELNDDILNIKMLDPNSFENGSFKLQSLVPSARENPQASVNFLESRIFAVITAFQALNDVIIAMPKKITCLEPVRGGLTANALAQMPFYENMHPHPYYSVFSNLPDWARDHFNTEFERCPLEIGDMAVHSYAGKKLSQVNKLVIDQYTSAVLRLNYDKMRNHVLTTNRLQEMIMASMFEKDRLEIEMLIDTEDLSLLHDYTQTEYNLSLFRILTSLNTKMEIVNFLNDELTKTNRFGLTPLESVWRGIQLGDPFSQSFNSQWMQSISIGDKATPYQMMIYETFSDFFHFNPRFSSLPDSLNAVTEVLSIHVFMILYPRITQRIIHRIGYRLTLLYDTMFPKIFTDYKAQYGDVRVNYGTQKFDAYGKELSMQESQAGYVYSIFTQNPNLQQRTTANTLLQEFVNLLSALRELVLPHATAIQLDRKRVARYPYLYDDYVTYPSWTQIDHTDYYVNQETVLGLRLKKLIGYADQFKSLFLKQNTASSQLPRAFEAYYTAWTVQLSKIIGSVGPAFQVTGAMMQRSLFNSPFYVGSTYNPTPSKFWYVQKDIGIVALPSAPLSATIVPNKIQVNGFKLNVGMCMAMTLEGEYLRNLIIPHESAIDYDIEQNNTRVRTDMTVLNGVECFKMMNKIVADSKNFGYAMQIAQWMTTPSDSDNPFQTVVAPIAQYMKMSSWVPLARRIFAAFNVDWNEYFTKNVSDSSFVLDGRYLSRTLAIVDPQTAMPLKHQPINSKFNISFNYIINEDTQKINVLVRPLLHLDSKIIYIQNDWYLGKLVVTEMGPTQSNLATSNWTDSTTYNLRSRFFKSTMKNGQVAQFEYVSDRDGRKKTLTLPCSAENAPILLLRLDSLTQIPTQYLRVVAKAISLGKLILKIKNLNLRVFIEDKPSRTEDYSIPYMDENEIYNIISQPEGTILDWHFISTNYATNFSGNALVVPGYIQWFATEHEADKNIFVSSITNAITRPSQTILPTGDEMGYGPDEYGLKFTDKTLKIASNIVNWNNSVPTISTQLLNNLKINIIPWLPQFTTLS